MARPPYEFACRACGWRGTAPTLDAHLNAWCPTCGKLADFADISDKRRRHDDERRQG